MRRTDTPTLIEALRILAAEIQSGDGVANACIAEGANRLEELGRVVADVAASSDHAQRIRESCARGGIDAVSHYTRPMAARVLKISLSAVHDRVKRQTLVSVERDGEILIPAWAMVQALEQKAKRCAKR